MVSLLQVLLLTLAVEAAPHEGRTKLVFSVDQGFGNGLVVNRDLVGARRIARTLRTLEPKYDVYALFEPQVANKKKLDAVLDVFVEEEIPFVFDVWSSDAMTLGTTTPQNAPADGPHGVAISLEDLSQYKHRYGRHLAGMRIMEVLSQDFTIRAVRTTNPEWNTAGWKLPDDEFFQPEIARPFLRFAKRHGMFVQWSDWHWYEFSSWSEPLKAQEGMIRKLLGEFPGLVTVTYANNEPAEASLRRLQTWHKAVEPFVRSGARDFGLSDQAWLREPETQCPVEDIIAWARRARELDCRYIQFEPVWYFFKLPRGTFGPGDYTSDQKWRDRGAATPAFRALCESMLDQPVPAAQEADAGPDVRIVVDTDKSLGELYNFWDVSPCTVQAPFKDNEKHEELRRTYPFARYINCVRFLGGKDMEKDDYFRGVDEKGQAICDFTEGLALLSGIRSHGFTPWIVLDNIPAEMSDDPVKNRYGNTDAPTDYTVWTSYIRQLVQALVAKFGRDEVSEWRFRVGTEPDLKPGHWSGTKEEYLKHYDHTVAAVLSVLPDATIGPGNVLDPAKKGRAKRWGLEIIDHCATGTNYATGLRGTPMEFFACSYYTDVNKPDERFALTIKAMRDKLGQYPQFANVPVEIHEFGILSENGKWIIGDGTEWGGSWTAHMANKVYKARVPRVYQWAWNTTKAGGIPIPVTHVLGMLEDKVGGAWLSATVDRESEKDDIGCIASTKNGSIDLLVFRHRTTRDSRQPKRVRIVLEGKSLERKQWRITRGSIIDHEHAGFMHEHKANLAEARKNMGEGDNPYAVAAGVIMANRRQYLSMSGLNQLKELPRLFGDESGRIRFDLQMEGHSVLSLGLEQATTR